LAIWIGLGGWLFNWIKALIKDWGIGELIGFTLFKPLFGFLKLGTKAKRDSHF